MAREYLLSESGTDYRANLHCHTKLSDGEMTPIEVKEFYKKEGYSIVAYTDHDVFIPHPELCDSEFLALNGFEAEFHDWNETTRNRRRTTHINMIALDKNIENQPCFCRDGYIYFTPQSSKDMVKFDETKPDFIRKYLPENVNLYMKKCKEEGFFVTYNHPTWSRESLNEYGKYEEMNALEIMNGGTLESGYFEYNAHAFDDLLRQGKKICCVAGDDNHSDFDAFWAWTVIRADALTYKDVANSLKTGNFYATNGPEFKSLYVEDGKMFAETEGEVKDIIFSTGVRHVKHFYDKKTGAVTKGEFEFNCKEDEYVRVTLIGKDGTFAFSNPYFIKDGASICR